ncbi:flavodoxin [Feifania hominis]|uniref:Flavodoxin n=1 Tax=Feifania hominis TaxID=2763660 RepID=A0A926DCX9_9FIRM|nr:flavodoxin [Feifania hominis]MBC8536303.1 flavodoxin [Feifania hominis]
MKKIAVIYWTGTGNTEAMAHSVADGARTAGAEVAIQCVGDIAADTAAGFDALALGCPAMGAEVLEETEFEPFFAELEPQLGGKTVGLFGSYGWGDGQWMRDWKERTIAAGANLCGEPVMANEAPGVTELDECRALGEALTK